mmetsp:Transcript_20955/g.51632  ORF Transcript_20955/g.51632 Transcript_20955/m.51632 type:complete len:232 (+) Transcript_20955:118-813(+)|eukprot:CAMPEP_0174906694 /NCGR_PEP_ID=MMETSP0167-20121228/58043_1 /TAXON_ID=38298 /ORGANISM="Rhodella maculata, Strain CCMP736" /LENGTH=231 /DNA_ID=CAMNT_0016149989 /DNA_START=100 /DNA_END=795 /DNA_ORIENTATION=-
MHTSSPAFLPPLVPAPHPLHRAAAALPLRPSRALPLAHPGSSPRPAPARRARNSNNHRVAAPAAPPTALAFPAFAPPPSLLGLVALLALAALGAVARVLRQRAAARAHAERKAAMEREAEEEARRVEEARVFLKGFHERAAELRVGEKEDEDDDGSKAGYEVEFPGKGGEKGFGFAVGRTGGAVLEPPGSRAEDGTGGSVGKGGDGAEGLAGETEVEMLKRMWGGEGPALK